MNIYPGYLRNVVYPVPQVRLPVIPPVSPAEPDINTCTGIPVRQRKILCEAPRIPAEIILDLGPIRRIQNNKNWLAVLCGPTGSGKSHWAIRCCEYIDGRFNKSFNVDKIVFSVQEWLNVFEECDPGDIILFDEGEEWSSRRAMETKNVEFSNILSMIRFTQISCIFTLPSLQMIDINARRLMHNYMYCIDFDRISAPAWMKCRSGVHYYDVKINRLPIKGTEDYWFQHPYIHGTKISKLWLLDASEDLLEAYERKKRTAFHGKLDMAQARIAKKNRKEEAKDVKLSREYDSRADERNRKKLQNME